AFAKLGSISLIGTPARYILDKFPVKFLIWKPGLSSLFFLNKLLIASKTLTTILASLGSPKRPIISNTLLSISSSGESGRFLSADNITSWFSTYLLIPFNLLERSVFVT